MHRCSNGLAGVTGGIVGAAARSLSYSGPDIEQEPMERCGGRREKARLGRSRRSEVPSQLGTAHGRLPPDPCSEKDKREGFRGRGRGLPVLEHGSLSDCAT